MLGGQRHALNGFSQVQSHRKETEDYKHEQEHWRSLHMLREPVRYPSYNEVGKSIFGINT